jgi:hypothetical protein
MTKSVPSSELETLDQLLGGDLVLTVVRSFYGNDDKFVAGVLGLVGNRCATVVHAGRAVPEWKVAEILRQPIIPEILSQHALSITEHGASRVS